MSTPTSAPVIAGTRLRKGNAASAHGAAKFTADTLAIAKRLGAIGPCAGPLGRPGTLVVRTDSAYYGEAVVAAARRAGARFSVTARMNPQITAAITRIEEDAWQAIRYPNAVWDEEGRCWISDAQVTEIDHVAFTSKPKARQVSARLIVRRVKRPAAARTHDDQGEIVSAYRHHAVFTDSPFQLLEAEADHRRHAIIEQVIADLKAGPLAHLPSGTFLPQAGGAPTRTPRGWSSPLSPTTCCAPPARSPAATTPVSARPPSATGWSRSPPGSLEARGV